MRSSRAPPGSSAAAARGPRVLVQTRVPDHEVIDAALHGDPSRVSAAERARRSDLRFPPFSAMAAVSGAGAAALIEGVGALDVGLLGVEVLGPAKGTWLVRADTHEALSDAILRSPRPSERVRIEVDPLRI